MFKVVQTLGSAEMDRKKRRKGEARGEERREQHLRETQIMKNL